MRASSRKSASLWTHHLPLVILATVWMGCSSSPTKPKTDGGAGTGGHAGAAGGMAGTGHSGGAAGGGGTTGLGGNAGAGGAIDGGMADGSAGAGGAAGSKKDGGSDAAAGAAGSGAGGGAPVDGGHAGAGGTGAAGKSGNNDGGGVDGCVAGDLAGTGVPVGTVATASSSLSSDAGPDKAIDGDTTTRWNAGAVTGWITLTFPAPVAISGLRLHVHGSPENTQSYTVTSSSSTTAIGSATANVTAQPGLVLPDIPVLPGSYSNITITVDGGAAWVAIDAIWLLPLACH